MDGFISFTTEVSFGTGFFNPVNQRKIRKFFFSFSIVQRFSFFHACHCTRFCDERKALSIVNPFFDHEVTLSLDKGIFLI
jgi:hypothetical protein